MAKTKKLRKGPTDSATKFSVGTKKNIINNIININNINNINNIINMFLTDF